jgi:hypothetical protein
MGTRKPLPVGGMVDEVVINDLFSARERVAFHVTQTGGYAGGLAGVDDRRRGARARLDCVGLARVIDGQVASVRAITDRLGTVRDLLAAS